MLQMYTIQAYRTYNKLPVNNIVKAKLELRNGKYFIEIPKTLIDLYSLKLGMVFEIKAVEHVKNMLVLNISTSLTKK